MKCRMKTASIDAQQFFPDKKPWPRSVREVVRMTPDGDHVCHVIHTQGGPRTVRAGDWVLVGPTGDITCHGDKEFNELYEITQE